VEYTEGKDAKGSWHRAEDAEHLLARADCLPPMPSCLPSTSSMFFRLHRLATLNTMGIAVGWKSGVNRPQSGVGIRLMVLDVVFHDCRTLLP
jgi:hypothetical protein